MRTLVLLIVAVALACSPAAASARQSGPQGRYGAKLSGCDTVGHVAVFHGAMRWYKGAKGGLEMAFTLQTLTDDGKFASAGAPGFDEWLVAKPGRVGYTYDKTVENLSIGQTYRVLVRFRWRRADGAVVAMRSRTTKPCVVPAANLNIQGVTAGAVNAGGLRPYTVTYLNDGDADSGDFGVDLTVDGAAQPTQTDTLEAGERGSSTFMAPACRAGSTVVATLDFAGLVPESNEADNSYSAPCPS